MTSAPTQPAAEGTKRCYLACDLGAESGRLMLGTIEDGRLALEELHRFPNDPVKCHGSLHWNLKGLWEGLLEGLRIASQREPVIASISTDSWGVDYVLIASDGSLSVPAYHYRDPRCHRGVSAAHDQLSWEDMFAETGLQFMPLNTVYQLMSEPKERWQSARCLLGIADAFNYLLSGVAATEVSFASTTQLYNPVARAWSSKVTNALNLPDHLLTDITASGTRLGSLRPEIQSQTGLADIPVIAACSHDTAAAVAAVPARTGRWAYLSSGTWSLMGIEREEPILNAECRAYNFTNEIGYGHSVRLLKNIIGLWLMQECRRYWASQGTDMDYASLTQLASAAAPFRSLIDPADPRFIAPDDMPLKIAQFCGETGQPAPESPGAVLRCCFESLALLYRRTLRQFAALIGHDFEVLHIVGGGSKNTLLNQFTANAIQIPVVAGPAEATAAGNILVQALALGHLPSLEAARALVARSTDLRFFAPVELEDWDQADQRFQKLLTPSAHFS